MQESAGRIMTKGAPATIWAAILLESEPPALALRNCVAAAALRWADGVIKGVEKEQRRAGASDLQTPAGAGGILGSQRYASSRRLQRSQ